MKKFLILKIIKITIIINNLCGSSSIKFIVLPLGKIQFIYCRDKFLYCCLGSVNSYDEHENLVVSSSLYVGWVQNLHAPLY
jgi:hypothetical protein